MNAVKQELTHRAPISLRVYRHVVPGVTLEAGVSASQTYQPKLAAGGPKIAVDVWRVNSAVNAELAQGRGLLDYIEGELPWRVPIGDRLDECAGREFTSPDRASSATHDRCANRIRDACSEIPRKLLPNLVELNNPCPYDIGSCRDVDARNDFIRGCDRGDLFHQGSGRQHE